MSAAPERWHVADGDLLDYVAGTLPAPLTWSVEAHLGACAPCRARLTDAVSPELIEAGWARVDAALDAPVPGPLERLLLALRVPEHTARLLAATPALRLSWLAAVTVTLALTTLLANVAHPLVFVAAAPALPLIGVAASFGPGIDPTYELTLVAPYQAFRLLLLRCVAVLSANTLLCAAASLALPGEGLATVGWFLPSLALTIGALLLAPRFGPVVAATGVGLAWAALVVVAAGALVTVPAQAVLAVVATAAGFVLAHRSTAFETSRLLHRSPVTRRIR